ncbi:ribosome-binding factor A, partial [Arcobacter sp. HD9-500m-PIT-SAG03]
SLLNKANGRIKSFCLASTGWYKCPDFKFISDTTIEKSRNIESLFAQISKSKKEEE